MFIRYPPITKPIRKNSELVSAEIDTDVISECIKQPVSFHCAAFLLVINFPVVEGTPVSSQIHHPSMLVHCMTKDL